MGLFFKILLWILLAGVVVANLFNLPEESFSLLLSWKRALFSEEIVYGEKYYLTIEWLEKGNFNLILNDTLFYSSYDLDRHTATMAVYPWLYKEDLLEKNKIFSVAVLGPVTGFLAREFLKVNFWSYLDFYTKDKDLYLFFKNDSFFSNYADKALDSRQLKVKKVKDYYQLSFLPQEKKYDFIYLNFLDPNSPSNERLYSVEYFKKLSKHLTPTGIVLINGTSPFFTRQAFIRIRENLKQVFPWVKPFWLMLSQQGEWGYYLASFTHHSPGNWNIVSRDFSKTLNKPYLKTLDLFSKDISESCAKLTYKGKETLSQLYKKGWKAYINKEILKKENLSD